MTLMICPNRIKCGLTMCDHYKPHKIDKYCLDNSCKKCGVCVKLTKKEKEKYVIERV